MLELSTAVCHLHSHQDISAETSINTVSAYENSPKYICQCLFSQKVWDGDLWMTNQKCMKIKNIISQFSFHLILFCSPKSHSWNLLREIQLLGIYRKCLNIVWHHNSHQFSWTILKRVEALLYLSTKDWLQCLQALFECLWHKSGPREHFSSFINWFPVDMGCNLAPRNPICKSEMRLITCFSTYIAQMTNFK